MVELGQLQSTLEQKRQELARLEAELLAAQRAKLVNLAADHGFETTDALIFALAEHASPALRSIVSKKTDPVGAPSVTNPERRRPRKQRAQITEILRQQIIAELKRGSLISSDIAAKFGVSTSSVNQMKHQNGLTRKRGKSRNSE